MSDALTRNAELLKQNRDAMYRRAAARAQNPPTIAPPAVGMFAANARVFDTVSGEEGEVIHAARHNIVIRPAE